MIVKFVIFVPIEINLLSYVFILVLKQAKIEENLTCNKILKQPSLMRDTVSKGTPTGALFKFFYQPITATHGLFAACSSANMADFGSPGTPSRHEKSLGLLTTKFVSLLQEAKDGVLDLKVVSTKEKSGFSSPRNK